MSSFLGGVTASVVKVRRVPICFFILNLATQASGSSKQGCGRKSQVSLELQNVVRARKGEEGNSQLLNSSFLSGAGEHQGDLAFLIDLAGEKLMPGVNSSSCIPLHEDRVGKSAAVIPWS